MNRFAGRTVLVATAGVLLVSATVVWWRWPEPPAQVTARVDMRMPAPADVSATATAFKPAAAIAVDPDARFELTPDGHLVPNGALLDALNAGLGTPVGQDWNAALRRRLATQLVPPALEEAMRTAVAYRAYARAHDDLLAAQHLRVPQEAPTPSDLARLSTWRGQRARLRAGMLDRAAVQAWYTDDDLQLAQAIDELQHGGDLDAAQAGVQATEPTQAAAAGGAPYRPVPRYVDKVEGARHQAYLLDVLARSAAPLVKSGPPQR